MITGGGAWLLGWSDKVFFLFFIFQNRHIAPGQVYFNNFNSKKIVKLGCTQAVQAQQSFISKINIYFPKFANTFFYFTEHCQKENLKRKK